MEEGIISHTAINWSHVLEKKKREAKHSVLKSYYSTLSFDMKTPLAEAGFVAIDFETTGLDCDKDDIISIGLIPFDLKKIYCKNSAQWLVNPRRPLREESVVIHGITHSDVYKAPDLKLVYEEVLAAMAGRIPVAHYHKIERQFLDRALKIRLGEGIFFPVIDTMALEALIRGRRPNGIWQKLLGRKPLSIRLSDCRIRYGLPHYEGHHALTDALATAELLQAQIAHHYDKSTPLCELLV